MPRISARDSIKHEGRDYHGWALDVYVTLGFGCKKEVLSRVAAVDTDEKWLELYLNRPGSEKPLVIDGVLQKVKLYVNYEVRDKVSGKVLFDVRQ